MKCTWSAFYGTSIIRGMMLRELAMGRFNQIVAMICERSSFQRKRIQRHLQKRDEAFFREAEKFAVDYTRYLEGQNIPLAYAVDAYLGLCSDMMKCQMEFAQTGEYPVNSFSSAFDNIYNNEEKMKPYMIGLAISQFLWETHYQIYSFFIDYVKTHRDEIRSYLEIGPGHGLFLRKALEYIDKKARVTAVDISPVSINIARSITDYFMKHRDIAYHTGDFLKLADDQRYDFIAMGEVLEHVTQPQLMLRKLCGMLNLSGRAFISTCVNGPAIDHLYHFRKVGEIRDMIGACGLSVVSEKVLPVEDVPMTEVEQKKITINYCAILKRTAHA